MRESSVLLQVKNRIKQIRAVKGSQGIRPTLTPEKHGRNESAEERMKEAKSDPVVAFSRPPPSPHFLGPLVAISLLETWSGRDTNDD